VQPDSTSVSVKSSIASMSLTWNGKVTRPQTWQRAYEKGGWTRLLFSLMYSASTQARFVDAWTRYWRDFPAHQSALPAQDAESKTSDGFGRMSGEWFARREHGSWALRTSLDLFPQEKPSDQSLPTWPKAGGLRSGQLFERPTWAPVIDANAGSAWPTPRTITGGGESGARKQELGRTESGGGDSQSMAQEWMTPQTPTGGRSVSAETVEANGMTPEGKRTVGLESQARHWLTPFGFQAGNGPDDNEFSTAVRHWPTPGTPTGTAQHTYNPDGKRAQSEGYGDNLAMVAASLPSRQVQTTHDGPQSSPNTPNLSRRTRLNPNFVEWLMGWEIGWTSIASSDFDSAETESCRTKQQQHSES